MSMLASIARISVSDIEAILSDPVCVSDLLDTPQPPNVSKPSVFQRIFLGRRSSSQAPIQRIPKLSLLPNTQIFDVEGYWHILHFLFTGSAWEGEAPKSFLVSGGMPVGRDLGYGAPRLLDPVEVQAISGYLELLTFEQFSAGYDIKLVTDAEIYWQVGATPEDRVNDLESLWQVVGEIRQFIADSVKQNAGILVEIY